MNGKASQAGSGLGISAAEIPVSEPGASFDSHLLVNGVAALSVSGARMAKIHRLRRRIAAGRYRISDMDLADKLIETMLEPSGR